MSPPLVPVRGVGWCGPGGVGGGKSVVTTVTTVLYGVVVVVPVVGWEPHSGRVACLIFTHPLGHPVIIADHGVRGGCVV